MFFVMRVLRLLFALQFIFVAVKAIEIHKGVTSSSSSHLHPHVQNAKINTPYEKVLNNETQWTFDFQLEPLLEKFLSTNVKLEVRANVEDASPEKLVSVTVLQPGAVSSSFRIPAFTKKADDQIAQTDYYSAERTICILDSQPTESIHFSVVLSTESETDIPFFLLVSVTQDFLLILDSTKNFTLSPNRPFYFLYQFDDNKTIDSVRILVDTEAIGKACMTLSVQTAVCPIYDQEENIYFEGTYQTIRSNGTIFVKKKGLFKSGFVLVILAHPHDDECMMRDPLSVPRSRLHPEPSNLTFSNISVSLKIINDELEYPNNFVNALCWTLPILVAIAICVGSWVALEVKHELLMRTEPKLVCPQGAGFWSHVRSKLHLSDFGNIMGKTGNGFYHFVAVTGTFYAIPVCQFTVYYYLVSNSTGDTDLCYYNYRCAQVVGPFQDFNHLVSNVAYVLYGIVFIIIAAQGKTELKAYQPPNNENNALLNELPEGVRFGVPIKLGMFKSLGAALLMEGVFSAAYHMCPNEATFQFDTCFMYVIALLIIIHLRQIRNIQYLTPYIVFAALACIGILSVAALIINYLFVPINKTWFCVAFLMIQLVITLLVVFDHVFIGVLREENGQLVTGWTIYLHIFRKATWKLENISVHRLVFPVMTVGIGVIFAICWFFLQWHFSQYLLYLLVANVLWNLNYYVVMKVIHGEFTKTSWIFPAVYFGLAAIFGGFAMSFFAAVAAEWNLSPAESKTFNQECLNMFGLETYPYDSHDAWHFLSATSLFFAFNGLLVLDDDMIATQSTQISVF